MMFTEISELQLKVISKYVRLVTIKLVFSQFLVDLF
jgi:hypothetical protein